MRLSVLASFSIVLCLFAQSHPVSAIETGSSTAPTESLSEKAPVALETEGDASSFKTGELEEQTAQLDQPVYKYVGNLFSLKFHRPSCPFARAMWRGNIIRFQYRKQAIEAGQKPCRYCLPPNWKSVGASILKTSPSVTTGLSTVENEAPLPTARSPQKVVK
jgi:hypothetical protein